MWKEHYDQLFNSIDFVFKCNLPNFCFENSMLVTHEDANEAIKHLTTGKASGPDSLSAEHFKHSSTRINYLLSMLLSALFIHGHLPTKMIESELVPIVKNKAGNICDKNNYRPIGLCTIMSKITEIIVFC